MVFSLAALVMFFDKDRFTLAFSFITCHCTQEQDPSISATATKMAVEGSKVKRRSNRESLDEDGDESGAPRITVCRYVA